MSKFKELITSMASYPPPEHQDELEKCGMCLKEHFRSQVAKEFLDAGKFDENHLKELFDEVDRRFHETELYKRVRTMLASGKSIEQIDEELQKEGISI
jgi:hypothetical protein